MSVCDRQQYLSTSLTADMNNVSRLFGMPSTDTKNGEKRKKERETLFRTLRREQKKEGATFFTPGKNEGEPRRDRANVAGGGGCCCRNKKRRRRRLMIRGESGGRPRREAAAAAAAAAGGRQLNVVAQLFFVQGRPRGGGDRPRKKRPRAPSAGGARHSPAAGRRRGKESKQHDPDAIIRR